MKFTWFHLMPYRYLPEDFKDKYRSVWVDIPQNLYDPKVGRPCYRVRSQPMGLEECFRTSSAAMQPHLEEASAQGTALPAVHLSSEHFFDDVVWGRLSRGEALPYPGGHMALVEFPPQAFPVRIAERLVDLKRGGLGIVLAHPERYQPVWADDSCLDAILDAGGHLLLDVCALVGKYGRAAQTAAEKLLRDEGYEAACSDAHKPADVPGVKLAIARLEELVGEDEATRLLAVAPAAILASSRKHRTV